jgi:ribonuclease BN (tRNA processing enzyme)
VLTHFPSADADWLLARRDEAARVFAGAVHLASPGMTFEIGSPRPGEAG